MSDREECLKKPQIHQDCKSILISELSRLNGLERDRWAAYEKSQAFFLQAVIIINTVLLFTLKENISPFCKTNLIILVCFLLFFLGIITYLNLLGKDIEILMIGKRYQSIRKEFCYERKCLAEVICRSIFDDEIELSKWSSYSGIANRMASICGHKTIIAIINCFLFGSLAFLFTYRVNIYIAIFAAILASIVLCFFEFKYAEWRYRNFKNSWNLEHWI